MTEDEARVWLTTTLNVSRETLAQLSSYVDLVIEAQQSQNLVSAKTLPYFWSRHIVDSAQLVLLGGSGNWLDIGSGAGLPGIVTAILTGVPTVLVEPRARRVTFLAETVEKLNLSHVTVYASTLQKLTPRPVDNITARALTALPAMVEMAMPFAHEGTIWILPKGKSAQSELASLPRAWQGDWEARASVTDLDSRILVGRNIRMNNKR